MVKATAFVVSSVGAEFQRTQVELDDLRPNEVLVDVKAVGICHTDIAVQHGRIPVPLPAILGHEGAGIVLEVGSAVTQLVPGDHVVLSFNSCGSCRSCKSKKPYQCLSAQRSNFGGSRADGSSTVISEEKQMGTCFFGQSSFSSPTVAQEASCVLINKVFPLSTVSALGCGFQTGTGSVYNVGTPVERSVRHMVIFGMGGVGCAALMTANHLARPQPDSERFFQIIVVDINADRLDLAKELGATVTINSATDLLRDIIMQVTNGEGVDAAIDCTGLIPIIKEMIELQDPGGTAVTVGGPPPGKTIPVDIFDMLIRCKTYTGCHQGNAYSKTFIPWLAELYAQGQFPLEKLQKVYPMEGINQACKGMVEGRVLKPTLVWDTV